MGLFKNIFSKENDSKKTDNTVKNEGLGLEVSYSVPNHVKVGATFYLQNRLSTIVGNSVYLRIVDIREAKRPDGWETINGTAALVDEKKNLYGVLSEDNLQKSGHTLGEAVMCFVTRTTKGNIEIWIPLTTAKLIENQQIEDSKVRVNVSKNSVLVPLEEDELELGACEVTTALVKEGSKAKPKIQIIDKNGEIIVEISARSGAYKELEPWVGKTAKFVKLIRRESTYGEGEVYYRILFRFL